MTREQAAIEQAFFTLQRIQAGEIADVCNCATAQKGVHFGDLNCPVTIAMNTAIRLLRAQLEQAETPAPSSAWQSPFPEQMPTLDRNPGGGVTAPNGYVVIRDCYPGREGWHETVAFPVENLPAVIELLRAEQKSLPPVPTESRAPQETP